MFGAIQPQNLSGIFNSILVAQPSNPTAVVAQQSTPTALAAHPSNPMVISKNLRGKIRRLGKFGPKKLFGGSCKPHYDDSFGPRPGPGTGPSGPGLCA